VQSSVPELIDLSQEPECTFVLYGAESPVRRCSASATKPPAERGEVRTLAGSSQSLCTDRIRRGSSF